MAKIEAICLKDFYPAYRSSGTRKESDIKWIVIHDTESGANTARGVARYFKSSSAQGSAHLVVDDYECYRCLSNTTIPWGAPGANTKGFHIELCGYARWTRQQWLDHLRTIKRAAYKTALHAKKFNIPITFRRAYGLKKGYRGITTHAECSKAFGGNHTDPGSNFPMDIFLELVKEYRAKM